MKRNRTILPNGCIALRWASLPKWVYERRLSDNWTDLPYWYRDTDGINHFEVSFRAFDDDPLLEEDPSETVVRIFACSRDMLRRALAVYKRDFNRDYDESDYYEEKSKKPYARSATPNP